MLVFGWIHPGSTCCQQSFSNKFLFTPGPLQAYELKMKYETTYLQTSKWHVKNIFMHLDFKYHTNQTICVILEKLSNPSILKFVLGAQGDGSCEHPGHFSIRKLESKKEGKDQESIQSSTTPDPRYQWEYK